MFIYEITETERQQIMQALEWAEWAFEVAMQTAKDEGAEAHVVDNIATEKADCGRLWDRINQMQPSSLDEDAMVSRVDEIKQEMDALFQKGE